MTAQPHPEPVLDVAAFAPPEAPLCMTVQVLERRSSFREALRRLLAGPRRASAE